MIFDFMSKPVTETELIVKIKKALKSQESSLNKTVQDLQSKNNLLSSMLDNKQQSQHGAGRMFEEEVFNKISQFGKVVSEPKRNVFVFGQEIDVVAFTKPPLPFTVLIFETVSISVAISFLEVLRRAIFTLYENYQKGYTNSVKKF